MTNWLNKIDIGESFAKVSDGEMDIQALAREVAEKLKALTAISGDLALERDGIVEAFEDLAGDEDPCTESFDTLLNELYDFGDTITGPNSKLLFINTMFFGPACPPPSSEKPEC